jgi:pimeloyl-ACP methyl ester carboxylesterase
MSTMEKMIVAEAALKATSTAAVSVFSRDGTRIGCRRFGSGPDVLIVHGAMETSESHTELAELLANDFTVWLPDRRGRGLSGPFAADYCLAREVEDVEAVLSAVGAERVFGVSAGAVVSLAAARTLQQVKKLAIWEPPLSINGSLNLDWMSQFDRSIAVGNLVEALAIATKATQPFANRIPNWLLKAMIRLMARDMITIAPTFHYDARLVAETADRWEDFGDVQAEVLIMGGGKSPAYLKVALDALEGILPRARRVVFPKLNHGGSGNRNRAGQPTLVADMLKAFFRRDWHLENTAGPNPRADAPRRAA